MKKPRLVLTDAAIADILDQADCRTPRFLRWLRILGAIAFCFRVSDAHSS